MERKSFKSIELELKSTDQERGIVEGYAAVFNNIDRHGDVLLPKSLKHKNVRVPLLWNHDANQVIGSVVVTEDQKGYKYSGQIAINSENEDIRRKAQWVHSLIKEGHVNRNSFGFVVEDAEVGKKDGRTVLFIKKTDVAEVSIVPMPANPRAGVVQMKSVDALEQRIKQLEKELSETQKKEEAPKQGAPAVPVDAILMQLF